MQQSARLLTRQVQAAVLAGSFLASLACTSQASGPSGATATPVYSQETGKLEQLLSDSNGDGKVDTRAFMDGTLLRKIEIDRNGDFRADRVEHYAIAPLSRAPMGFEIERAEEASGPDGRITRREIYERGSLVRVEEDADGNGTTDKWEHYERGLMTRVDLDLSARGTADRRMFYRRDGSVERVEVDREGRGEWTLASERQ